MTHAEQIVHAVARLAREGKQIFARQDIRDSIGVDADEWQTGYTAIFQAMRADHPGHAPPIAKRFRGVFRRVRRGQYRLTSYGQKLVDELTS